MSIQTLLLYTFLALIFVHIISKCIGHFTYWPRQGIKSHKFITIAWALKPFTEFAWESYLKYGKVHGAYNPTQKILIINDAKMARDISTKEFHKFPIRNSFHIGSSNINKSIFFMEANEDWKRIRSIVTPAFTTGKLKMMLSPINRITNNFIEHIRPHSKTGEEFDLKLYIGGFTMDVIACCAYGIEIDSISQPNHPVVVNAKKILNVDASLSTTICFMWTSMARFLKLEAFNKDAVKFFDDLTFQILEKRIQEAKKQNSDFLGLMIENAGELFAETKSNGNSQVNGNSQKLKGITKEEISGQGILFFIAGFDTTHATFDHIIYYLAKYPEWQEKLYGELLEEKDNLDYEKLKDLPILNAIINETLRLNPPLTVVQREAKEDCMLLDTGIKIPKNTLISIQPYVVHRLEEYFPDPLVFKPERFLNKSQMVESNYAFMPFGIGPRLCVGMRFAQNELRIGLANFVLNYQVKPGPNLKLEYFRGSPLMSPKQIMVIINER